MDKKTKSLAELAEMVDGELVGDSGMLICGFNDLDHASSGELTFIAQTKFSDKVSVTNASAIIVPHDLEDVRLPVIRVKNPYLAAAIIHSFFYERPVSVKGTHGDAHIGEDCSIALSASIAPLAVLGNRVMVAEDVIIESGVYVGDDVVIGDGVIVEANAVIRSGCVLGKRVVVYSGAVIGSDGYGYATDAQGKHHKRPQVGNVVLEDDVEIGANSCVDRATFGTTLVRKGTKIDNLVMVGHNVEIGEGCLIVSQSGLAGSCKLGNHVVLGGQCAVKDHVEVGDRVMAGGRSGINSNVKADRMVAGLPAISYKEWLRAATAFSRLPQLVKDVRRLNRQFEEISDKREEK